MAILLGLVGTVMAGDPIVLKTDSGELYGTLEVPKGAHAVPVALVISGSGPTDKDGNNGTSNTPPALARRDLGELCENNPTVLCYELSAVSHWLHSVFTGRTFLFASFFSILPPWIAQPIA